MDVERHVVVQKAGKHVEREVDRRLIGKVVEDLGAEHVDHAAGEVGERLGRVGLLLEALDPAVGVDDHDPELAHVRTRLTASVAIPPLASWAARKRREIDVGERVARHHEEGLRAEVVGDVANAARGAQQLVLVAVGELDPERGAVAETIADRAPGTNAGSRSRCSKPCRGRSRRMCSITGRLATGTIGFGTS